MKLPAGIGISLLLFYGLASPSQDVPVPRESPAELKAWLSEGPTQRLWVALAELDVARTSDAVRAVLRERLLESVAPPDLEERLMSRPDVEHPVLVLFSESLSSTRPRRYLQEVLSARCRRLATAGSWNGDDLETVVRLMLLDTRRFQSEPRFREAVLEVLERVRPCQDSPELRDHVLYALNLSGAVDFSASDRIEAAWGAVPRRGLAREVDFRPHEVRRSPPDAPIRATVYSLPSKYVEPDEAKRLLESVRALAPSRILIALVDRPLLTELQEIAQSLEIHLLDTFGRAYTPWPRDPFFLARRRDGRVLAVVRPEHPLQAERAEDDFMAQELLQGLPPSIDEAWSRPVWTLAPVTFHNGHVLLTKDRAWISIHTVESRVLEMLGLERVPVERLKTEAGMLEYVPAARRAAGELESLYGRRTAFVHPLPENERGEDLALLIERIGGGAGFDLDSLVTLVEGREDRTYALVGDLDLGTELTRSTSREEWISFKDTYEIEADTDTLRNALEGFQRTLPMRRLQSFLDLTAGHLEAQGFETLRLPLLSVPLRLVRGFSGGSEGAFLVTWNNVILEVTPNDERRAEGFASGLAAGDGLAAQGFARAGYRLDLLPPVLESVLGGGGYRCASQHLRHLEAAGRPSAVNGEASHRGH